MPPTAKNPNWTSRRLETKLSKASSVTRNWQFYGTFYWLCPTHSLTHAYTLFLSLTHSTQSRSLFNTTPNTNTDSLSLSFSQPHSRQLSHSYSQTDSVANILFLPITHTIVLSLSTVSFLQKRSLDLTGLVKKAVSACSQTKLSPDKSYLRLNDYSLASRSPYFAKFCVNG